MALTFQGEKIWLFIFWCPYYYHPFKNCNPPKISGQ